MIKKDEPVSRCIFGSCIGILRDAELPVVMQYADARIQRSHFIDEFRNRRSLAAAVRQYELKISVRLRQDGTDQFAKQRRIRPVNGDQQAEPELRVILLRALPFEFLPGCRVIAGPVLIIRDDMPVLPAGAEPLIRFPALIRIGLNGKLFTGIAPGGFHFKVQRHILQFRVVDGNRKSQFPLFRKAVDGSDVRPAAARDLRGYLHILCVYDQHTVKAVFPVKAPAAEQEIMFPVSHVVYTVQDTLRIARKERTQHAVRIPPFRRHAHFPVRFHRRSLHQLPDGFAAPHEQVFLLPVRLGEASDLPVPHIQFFYHELRTGRIHGFHAEPGIEVTGPFRPVPDHDPRVIRIEQPAP